MLQVELREAMIGGEQGEIDENPEKERKVKPINRRKKKE